MSRCLITAPINPPLNTLWPDVPLWKIPDADNGTLQAWDCADKDKALAKSTPTVTIYTRRVDVPRVLWKYLLQVRRSDSNSAIVNPDWKRLADCGSGDWFRIVGGGVRTLSTLAAGEWPRDTRPVHYWSGCPLLPSSVGLGYDDDLDS